MKPVIGLSTQYDRDPARYSLLEEYLPFVEAAGACAVIIPALASPQDAACVLDRLDGVIIPGGDDDIDPALYGQARHAPTSAPNPARDASERLLIEGVLERDLPFLGICRGMQMANVVLGGSLFQNVEAEHPDKIVHWQQAPYDAPSHRITLVENTPLAAVLGAREAQVNSMHRQAIDALAEELRPMAYAEGRLVEAFWRPQSTFFWGVQWHPEEMRASQTSRALGRALIEACKR